jgi:hypothetical protein
MILVSVKMTLVQSWATEGTVFAEPYYYWNVFWMYGPYGAIGLGLLVVRRFL